MHDFQKFIALVAEMRTAQIEYFKFRTDERLQKAKALESKVDKAIQENRKTAGQPQGALV